MIEGRRTTPPEELGNTALGGLAREVAAWLGHFDPKHEAGKYIQRITKGTLRATEAWTDGRHAEDDKYVELDHERAVALANVTEGAARAIQTEPSHGFVAWQALVDGYAPKSSNDSAISLQPVFATPKRCKDAKELKERLTAWSLKVAEYEHQFKVIDEAQKIFVVREMMPKDIQREFLTGPRKFDEIMEKLEIIVNEMLADNGPTPMDLGNVGAYDAKTTQSDSDTSNDVSHEDVCAIAWKGYKASKEAGKKGPNGSGTWHRGKGADEWTSGKRDDGAKKRGKKGSKGSKPEGRGKGKSETRYCCNCGEQGHIGVNCPYEWANSIDEEDEQVSSWESEPDGEKTEELASLETLDDGGEWCRPRRIRITRWSRKVEPRQAFHYLTADDEGEQVTVVIDSGAAENVMPRSMFPEIPTEETERSKNGKGFKGPGGENIKNNGQQITSVRTLEGFVCKST